MKIIEQKNPGERILGQVTCSTCSSKLEVQAQDCRTGLTRHDEYVGEHFCVFTCVVCKAEQHGPKEWVELVATYEKAIRQTPYSK